MKNPYNPKTMPAHYAHFEKHPHKIYPETDPDILWETIEERELYSMKLIRLQIIIFTGEDCRRKKVTSFESQRRTSNGKHFYHAQGFLPPEDFDYEDYFKIPKDQIHIVHCKFDENGEMQTIKRYN